MRTILRPLAIHSAYSPIETIVFCAFVGTLAYFHVLGVLRASSAVSLTEPVAHLSWSPLQSQWSSIKASAFNKAVDVAKLELVPSVGDAVHPSAILSTGDYSILPETQALFTRDFGLGLPSLLTQTVKSIYALILQTPTADILLILTGYLLMHYAFVLLFLRSRALGSSLWLPVVIISEGVLALFLTLCATLALGFLNFSGAGASRGGGIGIRELSEALPFLVCAIGFDKPMRLARAIFTHPYMLSPCPATPDPKSPYAALQARFPGALPHSGELILSALQNTYGPIIRDYVLEIAVLVLGYLTRIPGLREVCGIGAVLLAIDCVLMTTLLSSCFVVMVEVRRINVSAKVLRGSSSSSSTPVHSRSRSSSISSNTATPEKDSGLLQRTADSLLGPKGSALQLQSLTSKTKFFSKQPANPLTRLKLLLIATFLGLHVLEIVAPLTLVPSSSSHRGLGFLHERHHSAVKTRKRTGRAIEDTGLELDLDISNHSTLSTTLAHVVDHFGSAEPILVRVHAALIPQPIPARQPAPHSSIVMPTSDASSSSKTDGVKLLKVWRSWNLNIDWQGEFDSLLVRWVLVLLGVSLGLNGILLRGVGVSRSSVLLPFSDAENSGTNTTQAIEAAPLRAEPAVEKPKPKPAAIVVPPAAVIALANNELVGQTDDNLVALVKSGKLPSYALEKSLGGLDMTKSKAERNSLLERAVRIRRGVLLPSSDEYDPSEGVLAAPTPQSIPLSNFDYTPIPGACCENVVGYIPLPLGLAGPLIVNGKSTPIPMATAEGTLVASTSRGCKALNASGGVTAVVIRDGMSRGPALEFPSLLQAAEALRWMETPEGYTEVKAVFESTSRFARLKSLKPALSGRILYLRFTTATGDAMGMNMISKACEAALKFLMKRYAGMRVLALSGNYCTDKKAAMINWIEGRGKSVVAEAVLPAAVVKSVLKTSVARLVEVNIKKNLVGSAMAGASGPGSNAHAANIVTAIFLATGQDPAQNVESSSCLTYMEATPQGDLLFSVTMPSIEVGTVGGGTILTPQASVLSLLGIKGAHQTEPGTNAASLAKIVASAVMAGELSLLSALAEGELVKAHMAHNRSAIPTPVPGTPAIPAALSRVPSSLSMTVRTR